jgi:hypothetical protein
MAQGEPMKPTNVTLEQVRATVNAAAKKPHPRLFAGCDGETIRRRMAADPAINDYVTCLTANAGKILAEPLPERKLTGRRLLSVSRATLEHIMTLGLVYRVTRDTRYAERAIAEARQVCRFSDWNPSHFLDTGEMSLAVAIGLDWFDAELTPEAREELVRGLLEKGLKTSEVSPNAWVSANNNWGQVCHGGLIAAALALMDREPELAARIIHRAIVNVPKSMAVYAPDGGYPEGPGYWHYGTIFNVILIDCLESGLGTDFGLSALPGFGKTGDYVQEMSGPSLENFNYADGWAGKRATTLVYWFARRFGTPVDPAASGILEANWRRMAAGKAEPLSVHQGRFEFEFLYALLKEKSAGKGAGLPLDWQDRGQVPVAVHRSSWTDPNALYAGIKAGSPAHNHGQMDSGTFVLDAQGVRWATDLGAEDYNRIESRGMNLWAREQASDRWRIFRLSSASHNTLMIDGRQQVAAGKALITAFSADPVTPSTTIDLTPNYAGQASNVMRTLSLPERKRVEIRDRLTGLKPGSRVRWGMVTQAAIAIQGDKVILSQAGKTLTMSISGTNAVWKVYDTATPKAEFDSPNPGTAMIGFEAEAPASGELAWVVTLAPILK